MSLFRTYLFLCKQGLYFWLISVSILISRTNNFLEHHELIISLSIWSLTNELRYPSSCVINSRMRRQAQERWLSTEIKQKTKTKKKLQGRTEEFWVIFQPAYPTGLLRQAFPSHCFLRNLALSAQSLGRLRGEGPRTWDVVPNKGGSFPSEGQGQ